MAIGVKKRSKVRWEDSGVYVLRKFAHFRKLSSLWVRAGDAEII